jgi:hypothetical protein
MKKIYLNIIAFLICSLNIFAQLSPESYYLQDENKQLSKSNSQTPLSNSITDILTIGDTIIWLGTSRGVSLSTDGGKNWTNFYGQADFGTDNISAIAYNKTSKTFWCATAKSTETSGGQTLPDGTGLKYTTNFGVTWTSVSQPLDSQTDTVVQYGNNAIRALPVTVTIQNLVYDIAFTPNTIWIATFAGGLRKSTDNGATWLRVVLPPDNLNSIKPEDNLNYCLSPADGKFCGNGNLNHRVFSVISTDDNTLYVGTANGVNKSTDSGISWVKFNHQNQQLPISGNFITALGYDNSNHTVWVSSWKAEDKNEFYGVSSSSDGGRTWDTFLRDEKAHNFGFATTYSLNEFTNYIIVPTDNGAFASGDVGATWLLPNSIVDYQTNASLHTNTFYAAGAKLNNVWLGSAIGLVNLQVSLGQLWQGNWEIFLASQSLPSDEETYCFPNPFSPRQEVVNIKYSTKGEEANVTIRIFDFGFNYVRTLVQNVSRNLNIDSAPIDFWDGKDDNGSYVPNGVYFYRVDVGNNDAVYGKILVIQ